MPIQAGRQRQAMWRCCGGVPAGTAVAPTAVMMERWCLFRPLQQMTSWLQSVYAFKRCSLDLGLWRSGRWCSRCTAS